MSQILQGDFPRIEQNTIKSVSLFQTLSLCVLMIVLWVLNIAGGATGYSALLSKSPADLSKWQFIGLAVISFALISAQAVLFAQWKKVKADRNAPITPLLIALGICVLDLIGTIAAFSYLIQGHAAAMHILPANPEPLQWCGLALTIFLNVATESFTIWFFSQIRSN